MAPRGTYLVDAPMMNEPEKSDPSIALQQLDASEAHRTMSESAAMLSPASGYLQEIHLRQFDRRFDERTVPLWCAYELRRQDKLGLLTVRFRGTQARSAG